MESIRAEKAFASFLTRLCFWGLSMRGSGFQVDYQIHELHVMPPSQQSLLNYIMSDPIYSIS
jgi:hypothetical protein